jgi:hypothetical protein
MTTASMTGSSLDKCAFQSAQPERNSVQTGSENYYFFLRGGIVLDIAFSPVCRHPRCLLLGLFLSANCRLYCTRASFFMLPSHLSAVIHDFSFLGSVSANCRLYCMEVLILMLPSHLSAVIHDSSFSGSLSANCRLYCMGASFLTLPSLSSSFDPNSKAQMATGSGFPDQADNEWIMTKVLLRLSRLYALWVPISWLACQLVEGCPPVSRALQFFYFINE